MPVSETLETRGHLMDTGVLAQVLDDVLAYGGDYRIDRLDVGRAHDDESYARIVVSADDDDALQRLLMRLQTHGVNQVDPGEARAARRSTATASSPRTSTPRPTSRRSSGSAPAGCRSSSRRWTAAWSSRTAGCAPCPVSDVRAGSRSSAAPAASRSCCRCASTAPTEDFEFMSSVGDLGEAAGPAGPPDRRSTMREVKADGGKILWVGGPGVVHTGAAPAMVAPGRGAATSTCCSPATRWPPTTSSRRSTAPRSASTSPTARASSTATSTTSGPSTRSGGRARSRDAVEQGVLTGGIMHALVHARQGRSCSSARSATTGRCPTSTPTSSRASGRCAPSCPASASRSWSRRCCTRIATGNILPASVPLVCVDINPATVTKLADRGSRAGGRHRHRHRPVPGAAGPRAGARGLSGLPQAQSAQQREVVARRPRVDHLARQHLERGVVSTPSIRPPRRAGGEGRAEPGAASTRPSRERRPGRPARLVVDVGAEHDRPGRQGGAHPAGAVAAARPGRGRGACRRARQRAARRRRPPASAAARRCSPGRCGSRTGAATKRPTPAARPAAGCRQAQPCVASAQAAAAGQQRRGTCASRSRRGASCRTATSGRSSARTRGDAARPSRRLRTFQQTTRRTSGSAASAGPAGGRRAP